MKTKLIRSFVAALVAAFCLTLQACASSAVAVVGHEVIIYISSAAGTQPFTFQWQLNGTNISGATGVAVPASVTGSSVPNSAYIIPSFAASDAGTYTCVLTNAAGSATSDTATLSAVIAPNGIVTGVQVTMDGKTTVISFS